MANGIGEQGVYDEYRSTATSRSISSARRCAMKQRRAGVGKGGGPCFEIPADEAAEQRPWGYVSVSTPRGGHVGRLLGRQAPFDG